MEVALAVQIEWSFTMIFPKPLRRAFRTCFPKQWMRYQLSITQTEPEFHYLDKIVPPSRTSVDVGANIGKYTFRLAELTPRVHAFEPLRDLAALNVTNVEMESAT